MSQSARQWSASPKQLVGIVIVVVALYLVAGVINTLFNYMSLVRQVTELEAVNNDYTMQIEQMRDLIEYMKTDAYVEVAAKSTLLWGRPGEKLLIPLKDTPLPSPTPVPLRRP